ncbi:MAG TPA: 2-phospho-L-lactate transferase [Blastocatellia bacterium]|nr:2-phospho-L-lactate transferase [Blastocatellia bacterium]
MHKDSIINSGDPLRSGSITTLAGGIGAARFLTGLTSVVAPERITVIVNTGDDIYLHGLRICPDIDTVTYTLAGVVSSDRGWGIEDETFACLGWLARYAGEQWFNLGDRDLATHIYRTNQLSQGQSLSRVTREINQALGVRPRILPMTDSYTPTRVVTGKGPMHLQEYFVRHRCTPQVKSVEFEDISSAIPAPEVVDSILDASVVILCPSNPFISIGPILAVPGIRAALIETNATVAAITPIVGGKAVKGPAADMLRDLSHEVSPVAVATLYRDFLDGFVLDSIDESRRIEIESLGLRVLVTDTIMKTREHKERLAAEVVKWLGPLKKRESVTPMR